MKPYATPALYWLASLSGLVLALLADGVGDIVGLALLCLPIVRLVVTLARPQAG